MELTICHMEAQVNQIGWIPQHVYSLKKCQWICKACLAFQKLTLLHNILFIWVTANAFHQSNLH